MVLGGYLIKDFWSWFFIPVFNKSMSLSSTPLPHLTTVQAIGLSFMWNAFAMKTKRPDGKQTEIEEIILQYVTHLFSILLLWGTGWIFWKWFL